MFARSFAYKGLAQPCLRSPIPSEGLSSPAWRYFSSSIARTKAAGKVKQAQKQISRQTPPKASQSPAPPKAEETLKFAGRRPDGFGKLERKVAKEGELLLFKAPSQRSYILGAYGITAFCFAYSVYNSNAVFRDPIMPLPMWQQGLFGGICVMMSVMGTVFLFKTGKLIKSVKAVNTNDQTYLRFTVRRMIPFQKPMQFDVLPRQIAFSRRLVVSPDALQNGMQQMAQTEPAPVSFFRAPLKKSSMLMWRVFRSLRQLFTSEDFILLEVEGQKGVFRMDSGGYVSRDFLVVGNPVSMKR
ncbi:hypothetical protein P175DRAFT_0487208 [Aspergillus ochraceoroseus IBT 24754]|uniref:Uncharacterized protein n=3 Tax=Aspergillus subgen. Nidulantes TaxID=2720870 RepID=A0A0F8UAP0_9EURO|nr:uncharacterized protein P175DRAFT_0487208 [Aspergillus ochraceoroseus IBT 24754]KKK16814.1 hypothetical protein ARAM_005495 [Aspergillus rambellii]KKK20418.1 hypothetical protein AOCH_006357 [Aspergillus ochraceoroseus]PTU17558.1 hypothetical protein P175DRAFT_0487208 [Aspergillus ochraceoroseus IBT 24754]